MLAVPQGTIELIEQRQACLRLTARGAQPVAILGIKLRESDGDTFFHELETRTKPLTHPGLGRLEPWTVAVLLYEALGQAGGQAD
jgi:hypothetical protein